MFSVHTTPKEFGFVLEENSGREGGRGREEGGEAGGGAGREIT